MNRYAQLLNGKVIEIREADSIGQLSLIFGPETYWVDVTDVNCEVGYVTKFIDGAGVIFIDPSAPIESETINTVEEAREFKLAAIKKDYINERDKTRQVTLEELEEDGNALVNKLNSYGFDCDSRSVLNFVTAMICVLLNKDNTEELVEVVAWLDNKTKSIIALNMDQAKFVYNTIRQEQLMVNIKYQEKKNEINQLDDINKIMNVKWNDEEGEQNG